MRAFRVFLLWLAALGAIAQPGAGRAQQQPAAQQAQKTATLVADRVLAKGNSTLIAEGHVEILFGTTRLQAHKVIYARDPYSPDGGQLRILGPLTLRDGPNTVLLADSAELSADLRSGILRSARLVLNQQLQLATLEMHRVDGRYSELYKTVASSCRVCASNPTPLWEIRAKSIVHDQQAQQLYFSNTQLRVMDLPVFYLPRLRLPDPTLKRATGFLVPTVKSTSKLGVGLKMPYFITLGSHADVTVTPYLSPQTRTLEFRLRKAFRHGNAEFSGAISDDDLVTGRLRGYIFGSGTFQLPRDFTLSFGLQTVTDRAYLLDYDYSGQDRLASNVTLMRARHDELISASLVHYRTLRAAESNLTLPSLVGNALYQRRFQPALIGGEADFSLQTHAHYRRSDTSGVAGRDLERASARLNWRRSWLWRNGMVASTMAALDADFYSIQQDAAFAGSIGHLTPALGAELRWPLVRTTGRGVRQVLEPVVQILWSDRRAAAVPNEDSTLVEFDEGNLFSLSRFPGADRHERGLRANIGASWTRFDPAGWSMGVTLGRVFRARDLGQFGPDSGLDGATSNWLAMVQLKLPRNLSLTNRALFDDRLSFTKNEARIDWNNARWALSSSYIWVAADPTSEWSIDGAYKLSDTWTGKANWRFDFDSGQAAFAGLGLVYRNECVAVDLSLSRRFTSSSSVSPTTSFGLTVALIGFGTGGAPGYAGQRCRN